MPRPFTPLTGPDNLNVLVLPQRQRGGPTIEVVQVRRGNVEATCTGAAQPYTKVFAFYGTGRLSGASFAGTLRFPQGNYQQVQGRFVTDRKATGTLSMGGIRMPDGAVCATGDVPFTATR